MYEFHEHEQYIFDAPTLDHLAAFIAARWRAPCYLCAPLLGQRLIEFFANICENDSQALAAGS